MNIHFISLGCSKNRVDSEFIMGMLTSSNHTLISNPAQAQAIFINTCGFIELAKQEAIDTILQMAEIKEKNNTKLIVLGCLSQRYQQQLTKEMPEVDRFVMLDEYVILDKILSNELDIQVQAPYKSTPRIHSTQAHIGYLKISEGCSNNCSFCAIPLIRGKYHSYPIEELIEQAKIMAKQGVKELVLVAQDTTMYGLDIYKKSALGDLVEKLNTIDGLLWIRVLYMYPDLLTDELIEKLASIEKFVPYFDIPIQHSEDEILTHMKRRGDKQQIVTRIAKIRDTFTESIIRSTLIVGYPTETDEHFKQLLQFISEQKFDKLGAFTFSKEEDTVAYDLVDMDDEIKIKRYTKLMEAQSKVAQHAQLRFKNQRMTLLVDKVDTITKTAKCRSPFHAPDDIDGYVYVPITQEVVVGEKLYCEIEQIIGYNWYGKVLEYPS